MPPCVCLQRDRRKAPKGLVVAACWSHVIYIWRIEIAFSDVFKDSVLQQFVIVKHIWAQIKALRVVGRRTIICYSSLVLIKLFVTRFHCICPDYHHIAPESTKLGQLRKTQKKFWSAGERRFENSHSNFSLKEKSEGAGEMADSIPRYFSQRLLQLSSAILKWNRGRKILQYLKEIRRWWAGKYCSI